VFLGLVPFTTPPFSDEVAKLGAALDLDRTFPLLDEMPAALNRHRHLLFLLSLQFTELYQIRDLIISQHDAIQSAYLRHCPAIDRQDSDESALDRELFDGIAAFQATEANSSPLVSAATKTEEAP
jgi:hypothetical protein